MNMNIGRALKIKERKLFNLDRKRARLAGEVEFLKARREEMCALLERDITFTELADQSS